MMQAILIDPFAKSIATVETNGTLEHLQQLVQTTHLESMICAIHSHGDEDTMMFSEEIDLYSPGLFQWDGEIDILGRAIIIGTNADGDHEDVSLTVDEVKRKIEFMEPRK